MENVIRELNGQEAKVALAQFLGQTIGEIKKLDGDIVAGNQTLRGNTLNLHQIGTDIPGGAAPRPQEQIPQPPVQNIATMWQQLPNTPVVLPGTVQSIPPLATPTAPKDQFEFNFSLTDKDIFNKLDSLERQNKKIIGLLEALTRSFDEASVPSKTNFIDLKKKN